MNKKWKLMLPIVAALLLLSLLAPAVALAQTTTATRDITDQTLEPGDTTQVTVTIDVAEAEALALDENIPTGWTLAQVSADPAASAFNANTNEWVWFQAAVGTITVVYDLTAPADADGSYTIAGTIVGEDWSDAVGGETEITVSPTPEPPPEVELEFSGSLAEDARDTLVVIPTGVTELEITLSATADIDLELYDGDTFVIGWGGEIDSSGSTTGTYQDDTFAYSGWDGGEEYITADGPLSRAYTLKVYGFEAGDYTVTVSYMPAAPPNPPPTISITVPATVTLGSPVTVTVSATDPDGVGMVSFMVSSPWPEEWRSNSNSEYEDVIGYVISFDDEASFTFVPGWAGTYTVDAWAVDDLGNHTPYDTPVTVTFIVSG